MADIPTYTQADEYHTVRMTKEWIDLGLSTAVAVQKVKTAALTKAMDYIEANYPVMIAEEESLQEYIDERVQTACIMLAPYFGKRVDTMEATPEVLEKELQSGEDKIRTKYAVNQEGYFKQERFPAVRGYLEPVLAGDVCIKVVR